jgi:uncharacterized protein
MRTFATLTVLVVSTLAGGPAMARSGDSIEQRNKAIVQASFDAWQAGTGSPYDLLAEDASWTIVGHSAVSRTYPDREAFLSEVIRPFNARMRVGLKPTIRQMHADGDGQPYANTYAWFLAMQDGRVRQASAFFDSTVFNAFWERVPPDAAP